MKAHIDTARLTKMNFINVYHLIFNTFENNAFKKILKTKEKVISSVHIKHTVLFQRQADKCQIRDSGVCKDRQRPLCTIPK